MTKTPQQEVGPVTALVSILVALLVVFIAYSILLPQKPADTTPPVDTAAQASTSS